MRNGAYFIGIFLLTAGTVFAGEPASTILKDLNEQTPAAAISIPAAPLPAAKDDQQSIPPVQPDEAKSGPGSTLAVKIGTINGGMNLMPVGITINKLDWTITGAINYRPLGIKINHDNKTITGGVNLSPVDLKFIWSPEEVTVEGGANLSPLKYTVNWKNGLLEGYANHTPLRVEFTMNEAIADATTVKLTGYVNRAPIDLTFNKVNGNLSGAMNYSTMGLTLTNCDLYDFLQYFFLFVK